ncbi:MAG: ATP-binding protein, partial [Actinomycetota bacterium]
MSELRIGRDVSFPEEAVTQTFGILAKRGAGKSNTAAVMAEEMHRAHLPFVAVDPVGAWWGLRSSGDGKGPGLPIPIFGGYRGDVPLERGGAELIADLIVDESLSCVLDVSAFESERAKREFLTAFAERLFRRKAQPGKGTPLHLFLEEADDYAPQRSMGVEMARCLGAFQRIVKQGRARGLGSTMISQRSASLNKDLLTQIETLIVHRTTGPNDRKAIAAWIEYHAQSAEILESLHELADGEAWVWSPWLNIVKRVQVRRRTTFDSGATPTLKARRSPATLADVDLDILRTRMAATIEKAKAE